MMLDGRFKGLPPLLPPTAVADLGKLGWSLIGEDLPSPVAVLREDALTRNRAWMKAFCARTGVALAPHGKTTMSPELFALQREDGAWGMTVATVHQARVARDAGFDRIILANQVISAVELAWVVEEVRGGAEILPLVDSLEGVARLAAGTSLSRPIPVLLEVGVPGGRAGCRDVPSALAVAGAVAASPALSLRGIEAFEGLIPGASMEEREGKVRAFLETVCDVAIACRDLCANRPILTAGGSIFFDLVAERFARLPGFEPVLRSGCYLTGDHGIYGAAFERLAERNPAVRTLGTLAPALEVWARVLSRPEPGRAILGVGKRDVGTDAGPPVALRRHVGREVHSLAEARVAEVNDQHTHLVLPPEMPLSVGDQVALGITHPCTTFDRWRVLLLVDQAWNVVGGVTTEF